MKMIYQVRHQITIESGLRVSKWNDSNHSKIEIMSILMGGQWFLFFYQESLHLLLSRVFSTAFFSWDLHSLPQIKISSLFSMPLSFFSSPTSFEEKNSDFMMSQVIHVCLIDFHEILSSRQCIILGKNKFLKSEI